MISELQLIFIAQSLLGFWLGLWVAAIGVALVAQGRDQALTVIRWPFVAAWRTVRQTVRLARRAVGGLLVALGNWIRG